MKTLEIMLTILKIKIYKDIVKKETYPSLGTIISHSYCIFYDSIIRILKFVWRKVAGNQFTFHSFISLNITLFNEIK